MDISINNTLKAKRGLLFEDGKLVDISLANCYTLEDMIWELIKLIGGYTVPKQYDSTDKFEAHRSISSFKEYVLVWQTIPKVQSWYKEEDQLWRISSAFGLDKSLPLYSLGIELSLAAIYKRVENLGQREVPNAW